MSGTPNQTWIIADTNYFLHFKQPDQIDWSSLVSAKQVTLVVPMTVIDELDKHKNAPSNKLRSRAKDTISKLKDIRRTEGKTWGPSVCVEVAPGIDLGNLADLGLDENRPDDKIMAFAVYFSKKESVDPSRVFLVSNDFGMELKSEGRGVQILALPEHLQLPAELEASEKELRDLKKQNAILTNRIPKLAVTMNDAGDRVEAQLSEVQPLSDDVIRAKVEKIKALHPLHVENPIVVQERNKEKSSTGGLDITQIAAAISALQGTARPSREQWNEYNSELETFYVDYENYLRKEQAHKELLARSIFLDLYLVNSGSAPAGDVRVSLHFPDGFQLLESEDFPEQPEKPSTPTKPRATDLFEMMARGNALNTRPYFDLPVLNRNTEPPNVKGFSIQPTNSYEVTCSVRKAMHGEPIFLRSVVSIFDSVAAARSFTVDCKLICDEFVEVSKSRLHVVVNR